MPLEKKNIRPEVDDSKIDELYEAMVQIEDRNRNLTNFEDVSVPRRSRRYSEGVKKQPSVLFKAGKILFRRVDPEWTVTILGPNARESSLEHPRGVKYTITDGMYRLRCHCGKVYLAHRTMLTREFPAAYTCGCSIRPRKARAANKCPHRGMTLSPGQKVGRLEVLKYAPKMGYKTQCDCGFVSWIASARRVRFSADCACGLCAEKAANDPVIFKMPATKVFIKKGSLQNIDTLTFLEPGSVIAAPKDTTGTMLEAWWNADREMRYVEMLCGENLRVCVRLFILNIDSGEPDMVAKAEAGTFHEAVEKAIAVHMAVHRANI